VRKVPSAKNTVPKKDVGKKKIDRGKERHHRTVHLLRTDKIDTGRQNPPDDTDHKRQNLSRLKKSMSLNRRKKSLLSNKRKKKKTLENSAPRPTKKKTKTSNTKKEKLPRLPLKEKSTPRQRRHAGPSSLREIKNNGENRPPGHQTSAGGQTAKKTVKLLTGQKRKSKFSLTS